PVELRAALHRLEVSHDHATGVRKDVRHDQDAALGEEAVRLRGHRTVRPLNNDPRADLVGVVACDLSLQGGGDKYVDVHREELRIRNARHTGEAFECARGIAANVLDRSSDVDAVRRRVATAHVRYRDDPAPRRRQRLAVTLPTLPKPWTATRVSAGSFPSRR